MIRTCLLVSVASLSLSLPAASQAYVLDGLSYINCQSGTQEYFILTDIELGETEWTLTPSTGATIVSSGPYGVIIEFMVPGNYTLSCVSQPADGSPLMLSDEFFIIVLTPIEEPTVGGCYEIGTEDDCYRVCAGAETVIFTDAGEATITGAVDHTITPDAIHITWGNSGTGSVVLAQGPCEINLCFEILPEPVAEFLTTPFADGDTLTVCRDEQVFFENTSLNGLVYTWDFGDGTRIEARHAVHAFAEEGHYTVTLTAQGICECKQEKSIVVQVIENIAPQLDCVSSTCPGSRERYTALAPGCSLFEWTVSAHGTVVNGGGTNDDFVEVIWHSGPYGVIELQVDGCLTASCQRKSVFQIPVITPDGPVEGDARVCAGEVSNYTAPYFPGVTYRWSVSAYGEILGDRTGNQVVIQWDDVSQVRNAWVTVRYENCARGCTGVDALSVAITPSFRLAGDLQVCAGAVAGVSAHMGFGAQTSPTDVAWRLEDAGGGIVFLSPDPSDSLMHVFDLPPGHYTWVGTNVAATSCNEEARLDIQVTPIPDPPLGIRGPTFICPGQPYAFTVDASGAYATAWTITDGSSTSMVDGQTVEIIFGPDPPYRVSAVHRDVQFPACESAPVAMDLQRAMLDAIDGPDEACQYTSERYAVMDIPTIGMTWEIIPGDAGVIRIVDDHLADIFWTRPGTATLRLSYCDQRIEKTITVHSAPSLAVQYPQAICAGATAVVLTDQPAYPHQWTNASGLTIGTSASILLGPGTYSVAIVDPNGCAVRDAFTIAPLPAPSIFISTPDDQVYCASVPNGVEIIANTDGGNSVYAWFLNGMPTGTGGPNLPVTTFGTYHVGVENEYGCSAVSGDITFSDCCASGTCGTGTPGLPNECVPLTHDLIAGVTAIDCRTRQFAADPTGIEPGSLRWHVLSASTGLLDIGTGTDYTFNFPAPGYYQVILTGLLTGYPYDGQVCAHVDRQVVRIPAVADFAASDGCSGTSIQFEDLSTFLSDESIATWAWDFGDPSSGMSNVSGEQDPFHVYTASGTYDVTLTITLASGCRVSIRKALDVRPGPDLVPIVDSQACEDNPIRFALIDPLYSIAWDFGDPSSGTLNTAPSASAWHTYTSPGTYAVTVMAEDIYGCAGQATRQVEIHPNALAGDIGVDPGLSICAGDSVHLTAPPGGVTWAWNNGQMAAGIYVHDAGTYGLLMQDNLGCRYRPPAVFISVRPAPIVVVRAREILGPGSFGPWMNGLEICAGQEFEIQAFSPGDVSFAWTGGITGSSIQFTNEGGNLPTPGTHVLSVVALDAQTGCRSDSASIVLHIRELPETPVIAVTAGSGCSFNDNTLTILNPQPGITYLWSNGMTGPSVVVNVAGAYRVTATNAFGCTSESDAIRIEPSAPVDQLPAGCMTACYPLELCLPPLESVASFRIFRNGIQIYAGTTWIDNYRITLDGVYTFEITTINGCTAVSDPLYVTLYTGLGAITVETWLDVDGDQMVSAGDERLEGIPVVIISTNAQWVGMAETNTAGHFVFADYPATQYLAWIDTTLLHPSYTIIIDSLMAEIRTCGDSVVVQLLLDRDCSVAGPDLHAELCPGDSLVIGDSTWVRPGQYTARISLSPGCDSIFQVWISRPDSAMVNIEVWSDVDRDGMVSPADTLVPGISVLFLPLPGSAVMTRLTDDAGRIRTRLVASPITIRIDTSGLPQGFDGIFIEQTWTDTICGDIALSFLLEPVCLPVAEILRDSLCQGDSLFFDGQWITAGGEYLFSHPDSVMRCDTLVTLHVVLLALPEIDGVTKWSCTDMGSIRISVTGASPFDIEWENHAGDTLLTDLPPGTYVVHVRDAYQCSQSMPFTIVSEPPLSFALADTILAVPGTPTHVVVTGDVTAPNLSIAWLPQHLFSCATCPVTALTVEQDTVIRVEIMDEDGCVYILDAIVRITPSFSEPVFPNIFSPNGDGINDRWTLSSTTNTEWIESLQIFDRWGNLVFSVNQQAISAFAGWDGTFKNQPLGPAVFTYIGQLRRTDGPIFRIKGDVTLIR